MAIVHGRMATKPLMLFMLIAAVTVIAMWSTVASITATAGGEDGERSDARWRRESDGRFMQSTASKFLEGGAQEDRVVEAKGQQEEGQEGDAIGEDVAEGVDPDELGGNKSREMDLSGGRSTTAVSGSIGSDSHVGTSGETIREAVEPGGPSRKVLQTETIKRKTKSMRYVGPPQTDESGKDSKDSDKPVKIQQQDPSEEEHGGQQEMKGMVGEAGERRLVQENTEGLVGEQGTSNDGHVVKEANLDTERALDNAESGISTHGGGNEAAENTESGSASPSKEEMAAKIRQWKKFTLGPKISDWTNKRKTFISENPGSDLNRFGKKRVLIATGSSSKKCSNPDGDYALHQLVKNKMDYGRRKDFDIYWSQASLRSDFEGFWSKLPLLRSLMLAHPEAEWIWWLDEDAMITDMDFEIPFEKYSKYNLVLHGWKEMVYNYTADWLAINTGSFFLRNTKRSLDLLDEWASFGRDGEVRNYWGEFLTANLNHRPPNYPADDQAALVWLLHHRRAKWQDHVYIENSYDLHSFWLSKIYIYEDMVAKYHSGSGDRWPFVTHFVGCKLCGKDPSYDLDTCIKGVTRAFNFADNQVINTFGYRHRSLDDVEVEAYQTSAQ